MRHWHYITALALATVVTLAGQQAPRPAVGGIVPSPDRRAGEGAGPFKTLVIRGVTIIDGTGGPPFGPDRKSVG